MTKKLLAVFLAAACIFVVFGLVSFAADDELAVDLATAVGSYRQIDAEFSGGALNLTNIKGPNDKNESPAMFFKDFKINAEDYRYIKLEIKNDLVNCQEGVAMAQSIYFKTDKNPSYSEGKKVNAALAEKNDKYTEYTFDMGSHPEWEGTVIGMFYSFTRVKGTASIRNMRFVKGEPIKRIVLTDEEKIKDIPETTKTPVESKFTKTRKYGDSFTDVTSKDWFYDAVSNAYEYALVNGSSDVTYNPKGTMTVAEAVTLASRMHSTQKGDGEAEKIAAMSSGAKWYSNYVDYAKKEGFLKDGSFDSYDRPIKRNEMVSLFAAALPEECFEAINYVTYIPDVADSASYSKAVFLLYNAGICMGNDIYGTFNPDSNIARSEVAAIVERIANPDRRLDKDLAVKVNPDSAYYIVDDSSSTTRNTVKTTIQSGWDYDIRGGMPKSADEPPYNLSDMSDKEPVTLTRTLTVQDAGVVTTVLGVKFNSGIDGWYMETLGSTGAGVYKILTKNGEFYVVEKGVEKATGIKPASGKMSYIKIITDIAAKTNQVIIANQTAGTYGFASGAAEDVAVFKTGTTDEAIMDTSISTLKMYCNYLVNEYIVNSVIPYDWKNEHSGSMKVEATGGEFVFSGETGKASLTKSFKASSGEIEAQLIMLYPEMADGATIALTSGGTPVVSFTTKDGKMYANGKELREYSEYMWYMVRINANTDKQTAEIKVSGKSVAKDIPFAVKADTLDGIYISSEDNGGKKLRIDDIVVEKIPEYTNYPSEPKVPAGADDYYIGMNVCNLWRNGYHWGWDNISPYDENKPVLGWYDEGLPEVADWEIKFMAEHGIDFQLICWYHSSESPMKTFYGSTPDALFKGFMNAKYSDKYGKFALLWEAANGQKPRNLEEFKTRFVDFWVEYFFSDPRYMVVDNKLIMSIFGSGDLATYMGGDDKVKEAFDYLRTRVKEMGYDDIIIMACEGSSNPGTLTRLHNMGIDAVHAYNWGTNGYSAEINQQNISDQQKNGLGIIHNVPTVSTGFNNIAWAYTRQRQLTTDNMEQVLTWIRDKALGKFEVTGKDDAWKQKLVMLSTWNEYGEGTYMMPAGLNGFGYLDTVRKVFTKGTAHTDERPDNLQQARLEHLYPLNRELIRPEGYYESPELTKVVFEEKFASNGQALWGNANCEVQAEGDILVGTATNTDPLLGSKMPNGAFSASDVKQVKVWVDGPVGDSVEIYFQTEADPTWTAKKGTSARITKEGMNPVLIKLDTVATWTGTITAFRVDPITSKNSFRIEKIQFLGEDINEKLCINGREPSFTMSTVNVENDMLIPFFPDTGIGYSLGTAYTWDKVNKKLTLVKNNKTVVFTMGSDRVTVNGEPQKLGFEVYLEDGIPMIPIHFLVKTFGFTTKTYQKDGMNYFDVITLDEKTYNELNNRVENQWEFNIPGDSEGWTIASATATVTEGNFYGNDTDLQTGWNGRYDPALSSPTLSFAANNYKTLKIRMKHEIQVDKTEENNGEFKLVVYFKSSAGGLAESRTFRADLEKSSNGEYIEYTFNLADHKDWTGTISQIRVDPFNNVPGEFWIDYIRFEK